MATTSGTQSSSQPGQSETTIVDEIPESLNQLLLMIVKNFFSNEHFVIVYYIMRAECIREEILRSRLSFDQKHLRQLLAALKAEKLVKDHLITQKNENGRNVTITFYYINYRSVLNVLKYKIDHMRQKLESREKNDTNKAHYKCQKCESTYDMLEIDGILDFATGEMTCWRCRGKVLADESVAPSNLTRTDMARFNEQMTPLFSRIQSLHGIQLAPHLLEPDITKYMEDDKARELQMQQQSMDFTGGSGRAALGAVAHSYQSGSSINYQHGDQITVDLNADINKAPVEEAKQVPLWLQDDAIGGVEESHNENILSKINEDLPEKTTSSTEIMKLLADIEGASDEKETNGNNEPEAKRAKIDDQENQEEDEYDDEEHVNVGGQQVPLSLVTPKMVEHQMDDEERDRYTYLLQQLYIY